MRNITRQKKEFIINAFEEKAKESYKRLGSGSYG